MNSINLFPNHKLTVLAIACSRGTTVKIDGKSFIYEWFHVFNELGFKHFQNMRPGNKFFYVLRKILLHIRTVCDKTFN